MMRKRIPWGGLRTKMIAWFLVPTAIILTVVALFTFNTFQRVTEELVLERNGEITRLLSENLAAEFLEIYASQLSDLFLDPEFRDAGSEAQQAFIEQRLGQVMAFDGGVVILDEGGTVTAADPRRVDAVGQNWSHYPFVRQMTESPRVMLSNILPMGPEEGAGVALAVPLQNPRGAGVGIFSLISQTEASGLQRSIIRVLGGLIRSGEQAFLVDGSGRVIYHTGSSRTGEDRAKEAAVQRVLAGEIDSLRTRNIDGQEVIASFSPLPPQPVGETASALEERPQLESGIKPVSVHRSRSASSARIPEYGTVTTNWGLVVEESWAELTRTSQPYERLLLLLLALGALLPTVVIGLGARQITRPIGRLTGAASEVAGGNLDQVIAIKTGDELEKLAEQFNHMAAELRASYASLEQRVADRTRELTTLNAIAAVVSRSLDLEEILQAALARTLEATAIDVGMAFRLDEENETLTLIAQQGLPGPLADELFRLRLSSSALEPAIWQGNPVVLELSDTPESALKDSLKSVNVQTAIYIPLTVRSEAIGAINLGSRAKRNLSPDELSLLEAIGQQTGVAVENARLYEQAEETAVSAERNRLARDLHDAVTQTLFSASLIAEVLPRLWQRKPAEGQRRLQELRELTRGALAEMRTLLLELRPSALADVALSDLLRQLGESITGRARVPIAVDVDGDSEVPVEIKIALYRIAQEALNNVAKHSGASRASVKLTCQADHVILRIRDDGRGFDPASVSPQSLGLGIMRERSEAIGAELEIESQAGRGTQIVVTWPKGKDQSG